MRMYQHLRAQNDTNGNPRRLYVEYYNTEVVAVHDEGYAGRPSHLRDTPELPGFNITPAEYKRVKAWRVGR